MIAIALITLAVSSGRLFAQNVNAGEIRGTVADASGAVMPGVTVAILNTQTGVRKEFITNASGIYDALALLPGVYSVTFVKEGFNKHEKDGIELRVEVITLNAQMNVGTATQQVEVSAQTNLLRTENSEQGITLQAHVAKELPNVGQTWLNFTNTLPGVALAGGARDGLAVSVNGNQRYEGNFLADGGLAVLPRSNNLDSTLNFESLAEVKIITGSFDAQYGSGTAVFNQITKSGTNGYHGAAYDYMQNDALNARNYFSQSTVPHARKHQYGAAVGGPIKKDKLFFYFNWDSTLSHSATDSTSTYSTAAMRLGDFSDPAFPKIYDPASLATVNGQQIRTQFPNNKIPLSSLDPVALNIQKYFPLPNLPGFANNFYFARMSYSHPNTFLGKVDYNISNTNRLSYSLTRRIALTTPDKTTSATFPMDANQSISRGFQTQLTDVWTMSPSIVNEFRMAVVRQLSRGTPSSKGLGFPKQLGINYAIADVFPNITIGGPIGASTIGAGTSSVIAQISYVPSDVVTIVRGRHILKAGGQWEANQDNGGNFGDLISAALTFNQVFTTSGPTNTTGGLGYADFLTGQVSSWNALISPIQGLRMKTGQMFFQDDFKIRSNLTLNLGARYEIQGGWGEVSNRITVFDPTIKNPATNTLGGMWWAGDGGRTKLQQTKQSILPRVGFAWVPKDKWSVRGGFGTFSHRWGTDIYANPAARVAAYYINGTLTSTDRINPVFKASDPNPKLNLFIPDPSKRTPDSLNGQPVYYFPYDTPVARVYEWSLAVQHEFTPGMVGEVAYVGTSGKNLGFARDFNQVPENLLGPGNLQPLRPYPQFQTITANLFDNKLNYHGLQATFRKQLGRDLNLNVNYTWSKNLVYQDSAGWSGDASSGTAEYQRARSITSNYGLSNNDIPQMFKAIAVYQVPLGKGKALLNKGGAVDAVFGGWQTSFILIRHSGTPYNPVMSTNLSGALSGSQYPNRIASGELANPTIAKWFDTAAFVAPAQFTFGNSGRNVLRGPNWLTLDYSMGKNFKLARVREGMELQLRMDANNIMNHAVFANPASRIGAAGVATITSTFVGSRTVQLGARLAF